MSSIDTAAIDEAWDGEPSGVRLRAAPKPPLPLKVLASRYLRARRELEERMDAGERVRVELGDEVYEVVRVADGIAPSGEVRKRGGLRVEPIGGRR
jgi:hypothetical protein